MSSATKTLELLNFFSASRPDIGLSELCKLAQRDKATTYRHLQALEDFGLLEQNPLSKRYRLGPKLLHLAQLREVTVPRTAGAEHPLRSLAQVTGETAHVTVLSGTALHKLIAVESPRHSIRVIIDIDTFPLHATASGLCALAFGPADLLATTSADLDDYTANTLKTRAALDAAIATTRLNGFARADRSLETDVHSLAAPLFDHTGRFAGAVSVASVASRMTPALDHLVQSQLVIASRSITSHWGGIVPDPVENAWATALPLSHKLDASS